METQVQSKITKSHQACPCGESSDAYAERENGSGYCFSCLRNFPSPDEFGKVPVGRTVPISLQSVTLRGHSKYSEDFYGVLTAVTEDGPPVKRVYTYPSGWKKVRDIEDKGFYSLGDTKPELFGSDKFSAGSSRVITIVEGEEDAVSVFEILGRKYPVVSVRNAGSAKSDCIAQREYVNSFEKIVLCFDSDDPGRRAAAAVAGLWDFNKVHQCLLTKYKDPNDYEQNSEQDAFRSIWYNAKRFLPDGIVSSWSEFAGIIRGEQTQAVGSFPVQQLQEMSFGIRTGEVILVTALEGIGKTEVIRMFEHHLLRTTDLNIGCIHLEESQNRQLRGLAGYELQLPCHLPDTPVRPEEIDHALRQITRRDDRLHLYGHFGSDDPDLICDKIRFLVAAAGCRVVFLDHISMVVSGLNLDDERKILDYLSTKFATMAHDLDFCMVMVSHVNDDELTRGSRNISKVSDLHIHLNRNLMAPTAAERNVTQLLIRKNRFGSQTGPGGRLYFDPSTFMLREITDDLQIEELPPV